MEVSFSSERLDMIPLGISDAAFFLELVNTPGWLQFIGDRNLNSVEDAVKYIEDRVLPAFNDSGVGSYKIVRKEDGKIVGNVGIYKRDFLDHPDLGYALLPAFEGQGYATEAAKANMAFANKKYQITQLRAITSPDNLKSKSLLERIGFKFDHEKLIKDFEEKSSFFSINLKTKRDIIDRFDLVQLVNLFYERALKDPVIRMFFNEVVSIDFDHHIPKIYDFWESVLFGKGSYQGNPIKKHIELDRLKSLKGEHFDKWLEIWNLTIDELYKGEKAEEAKAKANTMKELMMFKIGMSKGGRFVQ